MPFVSRENLTAMEDQIADQESQIKKLNEVIAAGNSASDVLRRRIHDLVDSGQLLEAASSMAIVQVYSEEEERLTEEQSSRIIEEEGNTFREQFRRDKKPTIARDIRKRLEEDGTLAEVRALAEQDELSYIRQEAVAEVHHNAVEELTMPENKAKTIADLVREISEGQEGADIRAEVSSTLKKQWEPEALQVVEKQVKSEEEAKKDEFMRQENERLLQTRHIARFRQDVQRKLQPEWSELSLQELKEIITNEAHLELIEQRLAQEKETLDEKNKELAQEQLKQDFEGHGIDVTEIERGKTLKIWLGEIAPATKKYTERGYNKTKNVSGLYVDRFLLLLSDGNGKFIVKKDTLSESSNPYELNDSLDNGTVIKIGSVLRADGNTEFQQNLAKDSVLFYDVDTTDDDVVSSELKIACLDIDNVRTDHFEMQIDRYK